MGTYTRHGYMCFMTQYLSIKNFSHKSRWGPGVSIVASFMVKGSEKLGCPPLTRKMDIAGLMGTYEVCGSPKEGRTKPGTLAHGA